MITDNLQKGDSIIFESVSALTSLKAGVVYVVDEVNGSPYGNTTISFLSQFGQPLLVETEMTLRYCSGYKASC